MALRLREQRRRILVFMARLEEDELLGEERARDLQTRFRLNDHEMQQLLGHLIEQHVLEYVGPSGYDVRLTASGRAEGLS